VHDTRFIFVEGIMGAGKTTTAWILTEQIRGNGLEARFVLEGPTIDEPRHPLRVATDFPHPNAVWLDITIEGFVEWSLEKWRSFMIDAQQSTAITVCDGLLFHGNLMDLLLMDADPAVLHRYIAQVLEIIDDLRPVVIYFYHADVAAAVRAVADERGPAWESYQVGWKVGSPYGVRRSLQGFDGLVQLYRAYRALCDDLLAENSLPKVAIRSEGDWPTYYREVLAFLNLPPGSIRLPSWA
jgi:hypothetical protein